MVLFLEPCVGVDVVRVYSCIVTMALCRSELPSGTEMFRGNFLTVSVGGEYLFHTVRLRNHRSAPCHGRVVSRHSLPRCPH